MTTMGDEVWAVPRHPPRRASPPAPAASVRPDVHAGRRRPIGLAVAAIGAAACAVGLLLSGVFGVPPATVAAFTPGERTELAAAADLATVRVAARACPGVTTGSGFVVDSVLMTTAHLVTFETAVKVDRPGRPVVADVLASSASLDVAVIDAAMLVARPLRIEPGEVARGSAVVVAGHPGGDGLSVVDGEVAGYADAGEWGVGGVRVLLIDAPVGAGFSGGPVLDHEGAVVGMVVGRDRTTGLTVAVPGQELRSVAAAAESVWGGGSRLITHDAEACGAGG